MRAAAEIGVAVFEVDVEAFWPTLFRIAARSLGVYLFCSASFSASFAAFSRPRRPSTCRCPSPANRQATSDISGTGAVIDTGVNFTSLFNRACSNNE